MTLKLKAAAVLFEGGPWDGWSLYVADVAARVQSDERMGRHFDYRETARFEVHPRAGGKVTSKVWEYAPKKGAPVHVRPVVTEPAQAMESHKHLPHGVPPDDGSKYRDVYDAVCFAGSGGATHRTISQLCGWPAIQIGPLLGALVLGGAIVERDNAYIATELLEEEE